MRKLLLLFLFLGCVGFSYAQEDGIEVISLGRDFFRKESIPNSTRSCWRNNYSSNI